MKKALVLGASGGMGYAIVNDLTERGIQVRAFARNREKLEFLFGQKESVELVTGNAFNTLDLQRAAENCDVIFHSINIPYQHWQKDLLSIMKNVLQVAKEQGAKFVLVDNIYAFGRANGGKVSEQSPKKPHTKKGRLRLEQINLIKQSGLPFIIAHFPDFYGPNAENTMIGTTLKNVVQNKNSLFVGNQKVAREHIFTPDGAKALVTLALTEKAYGDEWNIPAYDTITGEEIVKLIRELTGYQQKISTVRSGMIQLVGLFNPFMRELVEMFYSTEEPVVRDGRTYHRELGPLPRTPYKEGLRITLQHMTKSKF